MPLDSTTRFSVQDVCGHIDAMMAAAVQFLPARQADAMIGRWMPRRQPDGITGEGVPVMLADAIILSGDLLLAQPSLTGSTAFDRLAKSLAYRSHADRSPAEARALGALRDARYRLLRIDRLGTDATGVDLRSGETLHILNDDLPQGAAGIALFARAAPLGQGRWYLPGAVTPLDAAALTAATRHPAAGALGVSANARWAEAVYMHVVRHGTLDVPGLNRPSADASDGMFDSEEHPVLAMVREWLRLGDTPPGEALLARVRQHAGLPAMLEGLSAIVLARAAGDGTAEAYERLVLVIMETLLRREQSGSSTSVTLDDVGAALDDEIRRGHRSAKLRTVFAELRLRLVGGSVRARADDPGLERLMARIQGLRAKTVANGCTEQEALAAAEKVAEMLDRYGLSLGEMDFRAQACEGIGIQTTRRRMGPIDSCVPGIAAFFDCRVWVENEKGTALRYVFFGLRADVAAAQYLYEMVERAFETETDAFRRGPIYADMAGERRAATNSFQIGLSRGIRTKLQVLQDQRDTARRGSGGRDLVVVKAAMVEEELAKLGLNLQARSTGRSKRVLSEAYAAGEAAGQRFEFMPGIGMAAE